MDFEGGWREGLPNIHNTTLTLFSKMVHKGGVGQNVLKLSLWFMDDPLGIYTQSREIKTNLFLQDRTSFHVILHSNSYVLQS